MAFDVALDGAIGGAPEDTSEGAPKGGPQVLLKLNKFLHFLVHKGVQNDSIKGEINSLLYAAFEGQTKKN